MTYVCTWHTVIACVPIYIPVVFLRVLRHPGSPFRVSIVPVAPSMHKCYAFVQNAGPLQPSQSLRARYTGNPK